MATTSYMLIKKVMLLATADVQLGLETGQLARFTAVITTTPGSVDVLESTASNLVTFYIERFHKVWEMASF